MPPTRYRCAGFTVDAANRRFSRGDREIALEPKVLSVVLQLVSRPGQLLTRDELLDAVWGHRYVTPSTLNRVIALARRAFGDDVGDPAYIQTVHGAGYRYIGPIERDDRERAEGTARFGPPLALRLPARLEPLIGREGELGRLPTLLGASRVLTVVGTGGMGKTQCALECARRQASDYPDGVWFFDLAPVQRGMDCLEALAVALSIPPSGERETVAKVCAVLADRRLLLLLDNCDRVATQIGRLVVEILRGTEHLKILATSQQQLSLVGERLFRMPPLGLPAIKNPSTPAELAEVASAPAVALLLARVAAVQPAFALTLSNAPKVVEICERLDGMPLAIELAAARFSLLSPEHVLVRLDQRFQFLSSDIAGRDPRHRNLLALLDWSYRLLSQGEQQLLTWLSVFVQGWTVDAAIDVGAQLQRDPASVVDLLTGLVDKSLVTVDPTVNPPRYWLLESVREFALAQLAESGAERDARNAHPAYVVRMSSAAHQDMLDGRMRERIVLLARERANIDSALDHATRGAGSAAAALAIAGSLLLYFKAHGNYVEGLGVCRRALAAAPAVDTSQRARTLLCYGVTGLAKDLHDPTPDQALVECARIARLTSDRWAEGYARGNYALWLANAGRPAQAEISYEAAERIAAELGDGILRGLVGLARGWICLARGNAAEAIRALDGVRNVGEDFHQRHFIVTYIGLSQFRLGDHAAAAREWHEAMRRAMEVGNVRGASGSIEGCAYLCSLAGQSTEAARYLGAAARIRERTEIPLYSFWVRHHDDADHRVRRALGDGAYEAELAEGAALRQEDAMNVVAAHLRAMGSGRSAGQACASTPPGS